MKIKKYNLADRRAAIKARREAVMFLAARNYSFRAIGYALNRGAEFVRQTQARQKRRLGGEYQIYCGGCGNDDCNSKLCLALRAAKAMSK
jgi:hypothetical protein